MSVHGNINPYSGASAWEFLSIFLHRLWQWLTGQVGFQELVSDEIQLLVLGGVALSGALVGTFLVLRKTTMLANALSHTILLGIVIAFLMTRTQSSFGEVEEHHGAFNLQALLIAAFITGIATVFLTEFTTHTLRLQADASIGLIFTTLFALGIVVVTLMTRSTHIGTEAVMGNADALQLHDATLVWWVVASNVLLMLLFFKEFQLTTFDPGLARVMGFSTVAFNYLLMVQAAATVIAGFRAVGVLMVLAFITAPVLTARMLTAKLKNLILLAMLIGFLGAFIGVALARHLLSVYDLPLSTGGLVVCVLAAFYVIVAAWQLRRG